MLDSDVQIAEDRGITSETAISPVTAPTEVPVNTLPEDYSSFLTVDEAAAFVGVCRRTLYNWIADNKVRIVRLPSNRVRVDPKSLYRPVA